MLQHESEESPVSSAAQARVTPDELNAALKSLEDQQSSTVTIGSVVDELRLNATPEQIWEQVQKQREQKQTPKPQAVQTVAALSPLVRYQWRWFALAAVSAAVLGHFLVNDPSASPVVMTSPPPATVTSVQPVTATKSGSSVVVRGNSNIITLPGTPVSVKVNDDKAGWTRAVKVVTKSAHAP